eukprot:TRINITY_DN80235_c0_g1_i1.p1 TRINITY_DN80235_c0_g1~~TRINITY_DN80235_c0_g1_i1.p1  ORF type:complete len:661 (+),score=216.94 TRINITY_DN80235_c0_g1_i1:88-2070(+)
MAKQVGKAIFLSQLLQTAASSTERPVTKVVDLLTGMQKTVEREAKQDERTYRDYQCWCRTNGEDKQKAIAFAQENLPQYQARVEYLEAKSKKAKAEYFKMEDEVDANKRSLGTATALREEQRKEFDSSKKELDSNLRAIGNAQTTLDGGSGFLQSSAQARKALLPQFEKLMDASSTLTSADRATVTSFLSGELQGPADSVQGVLNGMKDDFASDLEALTESEDGNIKAYTDLKEVKDEEIAAGLAHIEKKKGEKADADAERAQKQQEIKDMQKVLANDIEFAAEVVAKCKVMDGEYNERVGTRNEEIKAIKKAIDVLDSDEAHDSFAASLPKSFLQESSISDAEQSKRLKDVSEELMRTGRAHDLRLVTIAMRTKLDGFVKVKAAIDDMIKALTAERQGEVKKRDFCIKSFNKNEVSTKAKEAQKQDLISKIDTLKNAISAKEEEIEALEGEIANLNTQMKLASENRDQENFEFEHTVKEQQTTQVLLAKALDVLKGFYGAGSSLAQVHGHHHHREEPVREEPPKFKDYKNNKQSFGVMTMIQQIVADSKALEAESKRAEVDAVAAYESFSKDTQSSVESKTREIADKTRAKAGAEKDLVATKSGKSGAETELSQLAQTKKELEDNCNFLLKNFEMRQTAFGEEMESLATAKNILSGMKS